MSEKNRNIVKWAKERLGDIKREVKVYKIIRKDPRTPLRAKVFLTGAIIYAVSPISFVPMFIPIIGMLDEIIVISGLVYLAHRSVPKEVLADARERARLEQAGLIKPLGENKPKKFVVISNPKSDETISKGTTGKREFNLFGLKMRKSNITQKTPKK
jgi:uncharacterized membrane protein YkvA (DUF1232 family)